VLKISYKILYGLTFIDGELEKDIDNGKIILGGNCVSSHDQKLECDDCHAQIYKDGNFYFEEEFEK
jgi:hypothetical protein